MKDRNGLEFMTGDTVLFYANDAGTSGTSEQRLFPDQWVGFTDPEKHVILRRANDSSPSASPPVASPAKEEDRFAPGAYWDYPTRSRVDFVSMGKEDDGDGNRRYARSSKGGFPDTPCFYNSAIVAAEWIYRGNIATAAADFLIALTEACPDYLGTYAGVNRAADTLPSPAPTGSYTVAGSEYDELPSRFGEPDEDAVFKKQAARYAKLREEETAALGRFERTRSQVLAIVEARKLGAAVIIDKVGEGCNIQGELRCCGVTRPFGLANAASDAEVERVLGVAFEQVRFQLGARAMRGDR